MYGCTIKISSWVLLILVLKTQECVLKVLFDADLRHIEALVQASDINEVLYITTQLHMFVLL